MYPWRALKAAPKVSNSKPPHLFNAPSKMGLAKTFNAKLQTIGVRSGVLLACADTLIGTQRIVTITIIDSDTCALNGHLQFKCSPYISGSAAAPARCRSIRNFWLQLRHRTMIVSACFPLSLGA